MLLQNYDDTLKKIKNNDPNLELVVLLGSLILKIIPGRPLSQIPF